MKELALFGIKVANCRHLLPLSKHTLVPQRLRLTDLGAITDRNTAAMISSATELFRHQAPWLPQLRPSGCENSVLVWPPKLLINPRLVTGSAMGSIGPLFDKMSPIHNKHGPFELAFCIGDFFGPLSGDNDSDDVGRLLGGELRGSS